jgi:CHAT domain-containing protein/tetratricopeptide (TPR) repeat protein
LVACLRASTIDSNVRSECEILLQRDRDLSPELFAASQIARAKSIEKPATVEECGCKIEALTPIESSLKPTDDLVQWIEAKNLLSLTYWTRWQINADPGDLEKAIGYSQECLQGIQEKDRSADCASANYNLGVFYSVRKSADPHRDIELTIESMERALRGCDPGTPCYIDAQKRLMAALSRRSSGIESLNLDRGVNCINAAFADPTLTEPQRMSLEKSLNVLLNRRWGKAVLTLANEKHADATKQFFDTPMEVHISELRGIVGSGEPFDKKRQILIRLWWVANIVSVGCIYKFWHQPWVLMGSLALLTAALVVTAAFAAPEGIQKAIRIPWEYMRVIPPLIWWMIASKDPNKPHRFRMMGQVVSFISNPESASRMAEELWRGINKKREPTVWAVTGALSAWLSFQFPRGETGESIHNAITILQEAGDIFTSERFGSLQTGVDFLLAKAHLLRAEAGGKESVNDAVDLLTKHLLPTRMIGSRRKSGILWGQALQLLGDAYMKLASSGQSRFLNEAIQCYVESIGKQPLLHQRPKGVVAVLVSLVRMRPTNAMRAHALQGIASALIRLSDEEELDRRSLVTACLVNAHSNLNAPRFIGQLAVFAAQKETPVLRSETFQAVEAKLRVYVLTARALTLSTSRSESQNDLAEAMLRVCALNALRTGSNEIAYSALMDLGELLSRQKRHEQAVGVYDMAIRHIEASRAIAQLIERRAEIARYKTEAFDRIIVSLTHLGRISDAVGYVERGKSLGISDLVSLGGALRDSNRAPDLDEYLKLQVRATQLSQEITQRSQISGTTGTGASIWTRQYINSNRQEFYRTAERLLQLTEAASSSNIPPTLNVKALGTSGIQQFGRVAKSALVFFRITDEATYAFIVTPGSVRAVRSDQLNISDLDKALGLSASSLPIKWWFRNDDPEMFRVELNRLLNKLGDAVMRKITTVLREQQQKEGVQSFDRVVLFPSRTLSILPLHACWWNGNHGTECLLDLFPVTFAPSISIYKNCVETDRDIHQNAKFVGIFNPLPPGNLHFASWERSQMETIFDGWDKRLLHKEEATFTALKKANWLKSDILHFSCHGKYQLDTPFRSHLSLAGGDYLTLQYILEEVQLKETKLVVLSACESGVVDPRDAADEHYGLPTAFIFAGAPTVWATYWSVEEVATALLTVRAYENLRQGEVCRSEALRKAQLWLRRAPARELVEILSKRAKEAGDDPAVQASIMKKRDELANGVLDRRPFSDPYYWGAFHTVGA